MDYYFSVDTVSDQVRFVEVRRTLARREKCIDCYELPVFAAKMRTWIDVQRTAHELPALFDAIASHRVAAHHCPQIAVDQELAEVCVGRIEVVARKPESELTF